MGNPCLNFLQPGRGDARTSLSQSDPAAWGHLQPAERARVPPGHLLVPLAVVSVSASSESDSKCFPY